VSLCQEAQPRPPAEGAWCVPEASEVPERPRASAPRLEGWRGCCAEGLVTPPQPHSALPPAQRPRQVQGVKASKVVITYIVHGFVPVSQGDEEEEDDEEEDQEDRRMRKLRKFADISAPWHNGPYSDDEDSGSSSDESEEAPKGYFVRQHWRREQGTRWICRL